MRHQHFSTAAIAALLFTALLATTRHTTVQAAAGVSRQISNAGSTSIQTGDFEPSSQYDVTQVEFPGQEDEADGPGPYPGIIVNRSLSGGGGGNGASAQSGKKAKSNPA